jgi:hypothetical protein
MMAVVCIPYALLVDRDIKPLARAAVDYVTRLGG